MLPRPVPVGASRSKLLPINWIGKALAIFEDQPEFATEINGGGRSGRRSDADDKFSGTAAFKIVGYRENVKMPRLEGVKIRQNPMPGEYRYMQFAWKKVDGQGDLFCKLPTTKARGVPSDNPEVFAIMRAPGPSVGARRC